MSAEAPLIRAENLTKYYESEDFFPTIRRRTAVIGGVLTGLPGLVRAALLLVVLAGAPAVLETVSTPVVAGVAVVWTLSLVLLTGYYVRVLRASVAGTAIPDWRDPARLVREGIGAAVIGIAYVIVPLAVFVFGVAATFGPVGPVTLPSTVSAAVAIVGVVGTLAAAYVVPAALAVYADARRVAAGFAPGTVGAVAANRTYASRWFYAIVFGVVGALFAGFIAYLVDLVVRGVVDAVVGLVAGSTVTVGVADAAGLATASFVLGVAGFYVAVMVYDLLGQGAAATLKTVPADRAMTEASAVAENPVKAVDGVDLEVRPGETLGLVGESGCGKSTLGRTLLRLEDPTDGAVYYRDGEEELELSSLSPSEMRAHRTDLQVIFQNPFASLNPRLTIADTVGEPLDVHGIASGENRRERVEELLETVGLRASHAARFPHEFSGGQRQRIGIARALAVDPEFIVCDEPVSALDVSVQAQILNLLMDLQEEFGLSYLFIAHDLSVVEHVADRIAVMYLGEIVEKGPPEELFSPPHHPYTEALLSAIPEPDPLWESDRVLLKGSVPSPRNPPSGCRFHTRCPRIIPPEDVDIDQPVFRAITDLRLAIANREVAVEYAWEHAETEHPDRDREALVDAFVDALREHELDAQPTGVHRERVDEALRLLAEDAYADAEATLAEHYESVCERRDPELGEGANPKACHLYDPAVAGDPPTDVEGD